MFEYNRVSSKLELPALQDQDSFQGLKKYRVNLKICVSEMASELYRELDATQITINQLPDEVRCLLQS